MERSRCATVCCRDPAGVEMRERDVCVLHQLAQGDEVQVGFQGLRRRLRLHQEALRRSLKRLVEDGYVDRRKYGYGLTEKGFGVLRSIGAFPPPEMPMTSVAHLAVPSDVDPDRLVEVLSRRWFDGLRWDSLTQGPSEVALRWRSEATGRLVRLRWTPGSTTVDVEAPGADDSRLEEAARIVAVLLETLAAVRRPRAAVSEASVPAADYAS